MFEKTLNALEESLNAKIAVIEELQKLSDKQSVLLSDISLSVEEFDACIDEQDGLVNRLIKLDEEFEALYKDLQMSLPADKSSYAKQIAHIQELTERLDKQAKLLSQKETANKQKLEVYFSKERKNFGAGRRSSKAALDYYTSMSGSNVTPAYFMDQKQ